MSKPAPNPPGVPKSWVAVRPQRWVNGGGNPAGYPAFEEWLDLEKGRWRGSLNIVWEAGSAFYQTPLCKSPRSARSTLRLEVQQRLEDTSAILASHLRSR